MPLFRRGAGIANFLKMMRRILDDAIGMENSDPDRAILVYRRILRSISDASPSELKDIKKTPEEFSKILTRAGIGLFNLHDKDKAVDCFEKAHEIDPKNAEAWYHHGRILVSQNIQLPYAMICLKEAIRQNPDNLDALVLLGDLYRLQNNRSEALKIYNETLTKATDKIEILNRILKIDPNNIKILKKKLKYVLESKNTAELPGLYKKLAELENNIKYIEEGLKVLPENQELLIAKAQYLVRSEQYKKAEKLVEKILKRDPSNIDAMELKEELESYGPTTAKKEKVSREAVMTQLFGELTEVQELDTNAHNIETKEEIIKKDIESGSKNLEKDLEKLKFDVFSLPRILDATNVSDATLERIVDTMIAQKNFGVASLVANRITDTLQRKFYNAYIMFKSGSYDDAEKEFNEILKKSFDHANTWYYKAAIMAYRNNETASRNFLLMALKKDPKLKEKLKTDRYFHNYKNKSWFKKLL